MTDDQWSRVPDYARSRLAASTGWAAGEYLCADGKWRECEIAECSIERHVAINPQGFLHFVRRELTRQPIETKISCREPESGGHEGKDTDGKH